jgi:hypothetical protein
MLRHNGSLVGRPRDGPQCRPEHRSYVDLVYQQIEKPLVDMGTLGCELLVVRLVQDFIVPRASSIQVCWDLPALQKTVGLG